MFEKRRNSLYRWQVTVIFYTFTLLTTPFGRSIPTICIFSNPFFIPYEHELSSCEMGAIDRSDGRVCIIYYSPLMTAKRLQGIMSHIVQVSDTMFSSEKPLPTFDELPAYKNFPGCAWAVWGPDDQLGTVNLLTEDVVKKAAEEIKYVLFDSELFFIEMLTL